MLPRLGKGICHLLWLWVIALPLLVLAVGALGAVPTPEVAPDVLASLSRTFLLSGLIAAVAVVLGWLPGKLLGTSQSHGGTLLLLLLLPLVLPRYVLYYAWTLLLSPTTYLGRTLASSGELAKLVGTVTSTGVLVGWFWPLAALVLAQGWRSIDGRIWDGASLDAGRVQVFRHITLPLLARPIVLAFGVCFVLSLSEFATFHLAGVETVGTELAVLYELTGAAGTVARAGWPVSVTALLLTVALTRASHGWVSSEVCAKRAPMSGRALGVAVLAALLVISWLAPVALLVANVTTLRPFRQFVTLHLDDLGWSLLTAGAAAVIAYLVALSALLCLRRSREHSVGRRSASTLASYVVVGAIFLAMFLPASLLAVSLLKLLSVTGLPVALRQSWLPVSMGQALRFAGLAVVLLLLTRYTDRRALAEMAGLDGASPLKTWWHIHLPRTWPVLAGTFLLAAMFSFTELSATMVLLPAGLPNFAQRLLNQMHYARDQQVIASCLVLVAVFAVLTGAVVAFLHVARAGRLSSVLLVLLTVVGVAGCDDAGTDGQPAVLGAFGRTGAGPGEFLYPRAIALATDGGVLVADKTGRIQRLTATGEHLGVTQMPLIEAGKPTGMSLHEDGRLFVADTHYHRVAIFSAEGQLVGEFGQYGEDDGCFIYPTDVAFCPDGKIFVSEYGGNDRISVFTPAGEFIACFGAPGSGDGEFSRPAALCVDDERQHLYVADACNHRIAVYNLHGRLAGYMGSAGRNPGQLRYPYDLALLDDGTLVVCEYGNNRIQLFTAQGQSVAVFGRAGRDIGRLAYPWGVAVDRQRRAFIVDAGNNRIQVWQL